MKRILILFSLIFLFTISLSAQAIRIAYIDTIRIMEESNDAREAERLFMVDRENWNRQLSEMEADIQRLEREYETRRLTLSPQGQREAEERIMTRIREARQFHEGIFGNDGLAVRRNQELTAPIMVKFREAVEKIALEDNYTVILDATNGIIWAQERLDITTQVINEMNR